jgi:hypothetical protein
MLSFRLLVLLFLLGRCSVCWAADPSSQLRHDAQYCVNAWNRQSYPLFVSCLSKRAVPDEKTRAWVLAQIKDSFTYSGVPIDSIELSLGSFGQPRRYHALYACLFTVVAVIRGPFLKITDTSYVLGISENGGTLWRFIPLIQFEPAELNRLYPEFEGRITIPAEIPPSVEATLSN